MALHHYFKPVMPLYRTVMVVTPSLIVCKIHVHVHKHVYMYNLNHMGCVKYPVIQYFITIGSCLKGIHLTGWYMYNTRTCVDGFGHFFHEPLLDSVHSYAVSLLVWTKQSEGPRFY